MIELYSLINLIDDIDNAYCDLKLKYIRSQIEKCKPLSEYMWYRIDFMVNQYYTMCEDTYHTNIYDANLKEYEELKNRYNKNTIR